MKLSCLNFSVWMSSIPCGSPLTAETWDDLRRMFRWQKEEIQVQNEERGQFLCGHINAEHSLMGRWREKQEMELSGGQQLLNAAGHWTVRVSISERTVWHFWWTRLTDAAHLLQPEHVASISHAVAELFTQKPSHMQTAEKLGRLHRAHARWWITPKHISMMRQANNTGRWQGAKSSCSFEVSNIVFYAEVKGVRVFSHRSVNTQLCVCVCL